MRNILFLLLSTILCVTEVYAGGSLFRHKKKSSNPYGVYAVNTHICSSLECPDVRIISGNCNGAHMEKRYGVCICEKGYVAQNGKCVSCPDGQYSDGITGCQVCPEGTYRAHDNDTKCTACPTYECDTDECCTLTGPEDVCGNPTPELGFKDGEGKCQKCSVNLSLDIRGPLTVEECAKCDTSPTPRKIVDKVGVKYCSRVQCDLGYFQDNYGSCKSCSFEHAEIVGFCYYCSDEEAESSSAGACSVCDNTDTPRETYVRYYAQGSTTLRYFMCALPCPKGQFHSNLSSGDCIDCSSDSRELVSATACSACDNTDFPRKMDGNKCIRICPTGTFQDSDGACQPCSTTDDINPYNSEACSACDNSANPRKMKESLCVLDFEGVCLANCTAPNQCLPNGEEYL